MTRPIIVGLIGEVLAKCSLENTIAESLKIADELKNGTCEADAIFMMPPEIYRDVEFWEDYMLVNNLVAYALEGMTMAIVNPILERLQGTTEEDISAIIHCTDNVQIEAAPIVAQQLKAKYGKLVLRRNHEFTRRGPVAQGVNIVEFLVLAGLADSVSEQL